MQKVFFEINEDGSEAASSTGRRNDIRASQEEGLGEISMRVLALCGPLVTPFPSYCPVPCRKKS